MDVEQEIKKWRECKCVYVLVKDWYGDPNVINGTADCSFWRCNKCGDETSEQPEGWEDPDELNADDARDRRIDDALTGDDRYDDRDLE
jgi:hypothetical protein